ncbi:hypothetical protein CsatA_009344 [Cannabis sativa]
METEKFPLAPPHNTIQNDHHEVSQGTEEELGRKMPRKRIIQCIAFAAFVVLLIVVILVFIVVVFRFKTPKFRLREALIKSSSIASSFTTNNTEKYSVNLLLDAEFTINNRNYGRFKYEPGSVVFSYRGFVLGRAFIDDGRVRGRSSEKINAVVVLNSAGLDGRAESQLGRDVEAGVLTLTSYAELEGKVRVLGIKKKKSPKLSCSMDFVIAPGSHSIQNFKCL